ncbi:MAG TPA: ion transporter [Candidatus Ventrimonas merdavium]|nr:ion transporter [Candidatus Ventrimonas merdavium]
MKVPTKRRVFEIIQIGRDQDRASIAFDFFIAFIVFLNLFVTLFETFDQSLPYMPLLRGLELVTSAIFGVEYLLRIWTAEYLYPKKSRLGAKVAFACSFFGIIDLLSFLPFFLPVVFPMGIVTFRMFRVVRIFRLFRINTYYDAFNVITDVLRDKRDQIFSSVCILLILIIAASLFMYSLEHNVQPDKFQNAFSGVWWAVSTLLTVGYGDIYPVTNAGQIVGIIIAFLGVGTVAIPTGIISAGFVEQYTRLKTMNDYSGETNIRFITLAIGEGHPWEQMKVQDLPLPPGLILAVISRGRKTIVPRGDICLEVGDRLVFGAEGFRDEVGITLKELNLWDRHPWVGRAIRDLNISRQTLIVMVRREGRIIIPNGSLVFHAGDEVVLYTKRDVRDSVAIEV